MIFAYKAFDFPLLEAAREGGLNKIRVFVARKIRGSIPYSNQSLFCNAYFGCLPCRKMSFGQKTA